MPLCQFCGTQGAYQRKTRSPEWRCRNCKKEWDGKAGSYGQKPEHGMKPDVSARVMNVPDELKVSVTIDPADRQLLYGARSVFNRFSNLIVGVLLFAFGIILAKGTVSGFSWIGEWVGASGIFIGVILLIRQLSKLAKPRTTSPDLEGDGKGSHSILDHLLNREVNGQKPYPRHKDDHGLGVLWSFGNDGQATYERLVFLALFGIAYLVLVGVVTVSFYLDVFFGDGVHWFVNDGPVEPVDSMYFLPGAMWFSLPGLCLLWLVVVTGVALNSVAGFWSIKKWIGMGSIPFVLFGICFIAPWLMGTATPFTTPTPGFERGVDLGEFKRSGYSECPNCNLLGANLSSADLIGADLRGARLAEADLFWSNLSDADLTNANLDGVDLHGADLTGANLSDADLTNANLDGVDLHGANLTGANLTGANLTGANLTNANLTNAILDDVIGADFTGAFHIPAEYLKD